LPHAQATVTCDNRDDASLHVALPANEGELRICKYNGAALANSGPDRRFDTVWRIGKLGTLGSYPSTGTHVRDRRLRKVPLFSDLSEADLTGFAAWRGAGVPKNSVILFETIRGLAVHRLIRQVKVVLIGEDGRE